MKKYGGGAFKAKHYIFCGGRGGGGEAVFFFFSIQWAVMYNFLQVMVLLLNAVCSNGICCNEKKVPIFRRGLSRKKMSYASAMVVVLTDKLTL